MKPKATVASLVLCSLLAGGCARAENPSAAPAESKEVPAAAGPADKAPSAPGADIPVQRKLVQNAELRLQVESYAKTRRAIDAAVKEKGGFVASARVEHHDGDVSRATLTLRIPAGELAAAMAAIAEQGEVVHEAVHSEDVTESYYDTKARLDNARRLEARLLELLAGKTEGVKDLLEVERELARVREEIERHEGKIRLYDQQVALSTLALEIVTQRVYSAAPPASLGERIERTLDASWRALLGAGSGLVLVTVALVPWLLPLVAIGWLVRLLVMRALRRRRLRAA